MCIGAGELPVAERTSHCYFWISRVFALLNSFSDVNGDYSMRLFGNTFSLEVSSSSISNKGYRMMRTLSAPPLVLVGIISFVVSKVLTSLVVYSVIHPLFMIASIPLAVFSTIILVSFLVTMLEERRWRFP